MIVDFQKLQEEVTTTRQLTQLVFDRLSQQPHSNASNDDKPLNVAEAAAFLGIVEQTLYQNIKRVPHRKKFGRLYFFKAELLAYLDGKENSHE